MLLDSTVGFKEHVKKSETLKHYEAIFGSLEIHLVEKLVIKTTVSDVLLHVLVFQHSQSLLKPVL